MYHTTGGSSFNHTHNCALFTVKRLAHTIPQWSTFMHTDTHCKTRARRMYVSDL